MKFSTTLFLAGATAAGAFAPPAFVGRANTAASIAVGDSLPDVELMQGFPDPKSINLAEYAKGKNMIIVSLPGAFTPTWSAVQIPGYIEAQDDLKAAGIEEVLVYCVNDPAVMQAWASDQKTGPTMINLMGDPSGALTKELDIELTHPGPISVGIIGRSKRTAMHVIDGEVMHFAIAEGEDDPAGDAEPDVTLAGAMLKAVKVLAA